MAHLRTVVFAYHTFGVIGLEALVRQGVRPVMVFTHPDDPGENRWFASVAEWCKAHGMEFDVSTDIRTEPAIHKLLRLRPEIIFSFYYRHILPAVVLEMVAGRAYNLHGSLLPLYRGRCPVNWAIINGEIETGITLHRMLPKPDSGPIVAQRKLPILFEDTALNVYERMFPAAEALLDDVLPAVLIGGADGCPQDETRATCFPGRKPSDGLIDCRLSARHCYNLVRAVTEPYPGAFIWLDTETRLTIWKAVPQNCILQGSPGSLVFDEDDCLLLCGENSALKLVDVQIGMLRAKNCQTSANLARNLNCKIIKNKKV